MQFIYNTYPQLSNLEIRLTPTECIPHTLVFILCTFSLARIFQKVMKMIPYG